MEISLPKTHGVMFLCRMEISRKGAKAQRRIMTGYAEFHFLCALAALRKTFLAYLANARFSSARFSGLAAQRFLGPALTPG